MPTRNGIQCHKADIVALTRMFQPGIAKADP